MAEPVRFCGFNKTLNPAPGTEHLVKPLHVYSNGLENISCWKLSDEEFAIVERTREVWFSTQSGQTHHPIYLSGAPLMEAWDHDTGQLTTYHTDGQHVIDDARRFATLHHALQKYGNDKPYTYHLAKVVQVLREYGADWPYIVAGWLHDFIEDCLEDLPVEERQQMVRQRFGPLVEALVWACTGVMFIDGVKQNRKARNQQQYDKIGAFVAAAPLKCADRIANQEASVEDQYAQGGMYVEEVLGFDEAVGVYCIPAMRVRLLTSALAIADYANTKPELRVQIEAKLAEVQALIPLAA